MADDPKDQDTPADQVSDDATGTSRETAKDEPETTTETPAT